MAEAVLARAATPAQPVRPNLIKPKRKQRASLSKGPKGFSFGFGADFYEVERVKKKRMAPRAFEYLIRWAGTDEDGEPWPENWGDIRARNRFVKAYPGAPDVDCRCRHSARSVLIAKTKT